MPFPRMAPWGAYSECIPFSGSAPTSAGFVENQLLYLVEPIRGRMKIALRLESSASSAYCRSWNYIG